LWPRALAILSAFIRHLASLRGGGAGCVIRRNGHLGTRPFRENGEETGDVFDDLPGVLAGQITSDARSPDLARPVAGR
jgi:hypothetical protein